MVTSIFMPSHMYPVRVRGCVNIFKFMLFMIKKLLDLHITEGQGFIYAFNKYLLDTN